MSTDQDQWLLIAPGSASAHIGHAARIPDGDSGWRTGRIRTDGISLALTNGSTIPINDDLQILDLEGLDAYQKWLRSKATVADSETAASELDRSRLHSRPRLHQPDIISWAYRKKRAAIFASFGLGKTLIQLELLRLICEDTGGPVLQVAPLGVHQEFREEADLLDIPLTTIRKTEDAVPGVNLTHYEAVRDGKVDPRAFSASSLDEAACLRGMGSTETFRSFMTLFEGLEFKFVATATPSPNNLIEIAAYSAYLEILDVADIKTRYFQRNSEQANDLTLMPSREQDFWIWLSTWGLFVESPSDLGHDGSDYVLPEIEVRWHEVDDPEDFKAWSKDGQGMVGTADVQLGVVNAAELKRKTLPGRLAKMIELLDGEPENHFLLWHTLEEERKRILKEIPGVVDVHGNGSMGQTERDRRIVNFKTGKTRLLATKPQISGAGCNFQKHCHRAIYLGVDFKAYDVLQSARRLHRFGQTKKVILDLIYATSETSIKRTLERKWKEDVALRSRMCDIVREFGLSDRAMSESLQRERHVKRQVASSEHWEYANNDAVLETRDMSSSSVGEIVTSPPFAGMYQYASNVMDMSFSDSNDHFWQGMEFLTPELYRILKPGRIMVIHAKDRVVPGNLSGLGFQTLYRFSDECVNHYERHGFGFVSRITVSTDVVRENNSTYRLGYSRKMLDATTVGHGLPEYLLIFRKRQTSTESGYADEPVVHVPPLCMVDGEEVPFKRGARIIPGTGWSLAEWQIQAAGFWRSSGDRLPDPSELASWESHQVYKAWREECSNGCYDYHGHVALTEKLQQAGRLPVDFCVVPPHALKGDPSVWSNIARMRTLNMIQAQKGKTQHLCPMQFDIADRCIDLFSNPGEVVYDPFAGIGTVPLRAAKAGRFGLGTELSPGYWQDGVAHLEAEDQKLRQMSLFDVLDEVAA